MENLREAGYEDLSKTGKSKKMHDLSGDISNEELELLKLPGKCGFTRTVLIRRQKGATLDKKGNSVPGRRQRLDIFYNTPQGKCLRSLNDVRKYLSESQHERGENKNVSLSPMNFSFKGKTLGLGQFEKFREAREKQEKKVSEAKISQQDTKKRELTFKSLELKRRCSISVKRGRNIGRAMTMFAKEVGVKRVGQLKFICGGETLQESVIVDNLLSDNIEVKLNKNAATENI